MIKNILSLVTKFATVIWRDLWMGKVELPTGRHTNGKRYPHVKVDYVDGMILHTKIGILPRLIERIRKCIYENWIIYYWNRQSILEEISLRDKIDIPVMYGTVYNISNIPEKKARWIINRMIRAQLLEIQPMDSLMLTNKLVVTKDGKWVIKENVVKATVIVCIILIALMSASSVIWTISHVFAILNALFFAALLYRSFPDTYLR